MKEIKTSRCLPKVDFPSDWNVTYSALHWSVWKRYSDTLIFILRMYIHTYIILIPPNCTDRLHPLDISVNKPAKDFLQREFQDWYSTKICHQFQGLEPVDLGLVIMKPLRAQWMISLHKYLKSNPQIIQNRF